MRIHVTRRLPEKALEALYASGWDIFVGPEEIPNRQRLLWGVGGAVGILSLLTERIDAEVMDRCPDLRCISNCAAGLDNIDVEEARRRGIIVCNTPGVLTETCADFTWALILGLTRRLLEGDRMMRASAYPGWGPLMLLGLDLHGATLGVLGLGQIGQSVARRASAFGMRVLSWRRGEPLEPVLRSSDVVTVHLPLNQDTRHLLNEERLSWMKPGAYLVNTSRGPVLDEAALGAALARGHLAGAALDVFEREPEVHPSLVSCERVLLTPHIASATRATRERMALLATQNLISNLSREN
ncbi:MAG: D-glycerate dehydrogenase [Vulcanimicrobiota bacterium]